MKIIAFASALVVCAAVTSVISLSHSRKPGEKCIAIIYDNSRVVSPLIRSLSSYTEFQKIFIPISSYESGSMERCQASFIINTEFDNRVPKNLIEDFLASERNAVWMGYNVWYLGDQLNKKLGLRYIGSVSKLTEDRCALFYKGRSVHCSERGLSMQPEILPTNEVHIEIMAESRTRGGRELSPYVIRAGNLFYMADVTFGSVFQDFLGEFVGSPMPLKPAKSQQVAGPN